MTQTMSRMTPSTAPRAASMKAVRAADLAAFALAGPPRDDFHPL